jgi:hypothetical protein
MRIDKALEQISEIHEHLAMSQLFRGYRAVPAVLSGVLAIVAAWIQPFIVSGVDPRIFVFYWTLVAVAAFSIEGGSVIYGYLREEDPHARQRTVTVVGQLAPSLAVGVIVTIAFLVPEDRRLISFLPGIWALLYGLGLSASKPFLPRMIGWVAVFYILCGCMLLRRAVGLGLGSLSPWETGIPFGVGHILGGVILYWNLERRRHGSER